MEWAGESDAVMEATTEDGRPHAQYIVMRGAFIDLSLPLLFQIFAEAYGAADVSALKAAGVDLNQVDGAALAALLHH